MNDEPENELGETTPLLLRPLTPDEWERNQAIYERLLESVGIGEQEQTENPSQTNLN